MKLTNYQMEAMTSMLEPFLDRIDLIGYAAARNIRKLQDESKDYLQKKQEIVKKYGEKELDENGNETGNIVVRETDEGFAEAAAILDEFGNIEHEVDIFQVPMKEAIDRLTGREMLALDFLFTDE